jgi:hypothetical protein
VEHPENLALIVPLASAEGIAASSNEKEQLTALLEARVFIDGKPVSLWPDPAPQPAPAVARVVTSPPPVPVPELVHDVSSLRYSRSRPLTKGQSTASFTTNLAPSDLGSQYHIAALAFDARSCRKTSTSTDYDLTGQPLINSGLVLINGERVGLELQSAEADSR